jgi:hypothetical protein
MIATGMYLEPQAWDRGLVRHRTARGRSARPRQDTSAADAVVGRGRFGRDQSTGAGAAAADPADLRSRDSTPADRDADDANTWPRRRSGDRRDAAYLARL